MIPFYMILSHLVADFLLQPRKLVEYKEKSFAGVFIHAGIHGILMTLILFPYWAYAPVWYAIVIISFLHAVIDQGKISVQLKTDEYLFPFLLDQLMHFVVILVIIKSFHLDYLPIPFEIEQNFTLYLNPQLVLFLTIFIFCTAVYDIARFQIHRELHAKGHFKFSWNNLGKRLLVATIVFIGFLLIPLPDILEVLKASTP